MQPQSATLCKILILAFSSLPQIQLPLLPSLLLPHPPLKTSGSLTINRIPAWQVQRFSKKSVQRKPQRGGRWSKRLVQDTHPIRKNQDWAKTRELIKYLGQQFWGKKNNTYPQNKQKNKSVNWTGSWWSWWQEFLGCAGLRLHSARKTYSANFAGSNFVKR